MRRSIEGIYRALAAERRLVSSPIRAPILESTLWVGVPIRPSVIVHAQSPLAASYSGKNTTTVSFHGRDFTAALARSRPHQDAVPVGFDTKIAEAERKDNTRRGERSGNRARGIAQDLQ
jgi:hypothetical protein